MPRQVEPPLGIDQVAAVTRHIILDFVGPYEERFAEIDHFACEAMQLLADLRDP